MKLTKTILTSVALVLSIANVANADVWSDNGCIPGDFDCLQAHGISPQQAMEQEQTGHVSAKTLLSEFLNKVKQDVVQMQNSNGAAGGFGLYEGTSGGTYSKFVQSKNAYAFIAQYTANRSNPQDIDVLLNFSNLRFLDNNYYAHDVDKVLTQAAQQMQMYCAYVNVIGESVIATGCKF